MKKFIVTTSLLFAMLCNTQQVSAQKEIETSATSKVANCGSPDLTRLFRSVKTTYATLPWPEVSGAKSYDVEYKLATSSTWIVGVKGIVANANRTSNNATIKRLTPSTKYNWRVKTYCVNGSSYSASDNFTTQFVLLCDAKLSGLKNTNVTKNSATLNWNYGDNTSSDFIVEYKKVADADNAWKKVDAIISNKVTISNLESDVYYLWRVKENCSGSDFDELQQFLTQKNVACETPDLGRLFQGIYSTFAKLSWIEASGAKSYDVEYKEVSSSTWISVKKGIVANFAQNNANVTINRLIPGKTYNWRVKTTCAANLSNYSAPASFTTSPVILCDPKIDNLKTTNVTKNSAKLNWDYGNNSAVGYIVEYKKAADFEDETLPWERVDAIISNSVTISNLESNIYYVWRVKSNCEGSDFDIEQQFITQKNVDCEQAEVNRFFQTSPSTTSVTRTWAEASGAVRYDFEYKLASSSTWIVAATNLPADFAQVKKSYTITGQFQVGVDYNWRVKTYCANLDNNYSEVGRFTVLGRISKNEEVASSIKLYPNPVQELLTIELNEDDSNRVFNSQNSIVVIDTNGNTVLEQKSKSATTTIDVQKLKEGMYLLKVISKDGQLLHTQKFVKQ
jgi:Secretion system C-terminal sorting domain/Fibronectin type III domain